MVTECLPEKGTVKKLLNNSLVFCLWVPMKIASVILLLLLILPLARSAPFISEIMASPEGDDDLNEWVELHNNGSEPINVSGWIIGDLADNDTLEGGLFFGQGTIIPPGGFALITDDKTRVYDNFNVSPQVVRLYSDDASIGNGLSNNNDSVFLFDSLGSLIDQFSYSRTRSGKSIGRIDGTQTLAFPTPGFPNEGSISLSDEDRCDWALEPILNQTIFPDPQSFSWKIRASRILGNKTMLNATASITDLFGSIVAQNSPFTDDEATFQKTSSRYSPNLKPGFSYLLSAALSTGCKDANPENNKAEKSFAILEKPKENGSSLIIENILDLGEDKKVPFGESIRVRILAYRGNTGSEVVSLFLEDGKDRISKQSSFSVEEKFSEQRITIPVQLKFNCDGKFDEGTYTLSVKGLGTETSARVKVEENKKNPCPENAETQKPVSQTPLVALKKIPSSIPPNGSIPVSIAINNPDDEGHLIRIWSYVNRGSKSYSGDREDNVQEMVISPNSNETITLTNSIADADAGIYSLMVKYEKDGQKTQHSLSSPVVFKGSKVTTQKTESSQKQRLQETPTLQRPLGNTPNPALGYSPEPRLLFESPSAKSKKIAPFFFAGALALYACIATFFRKENVTGTKSSPKARKEK